ncbi:DUF805 domain-containing protein [Stenotrophomonas sp. GD03701]|uniref:DUF805 domain-containing protein n=1 Tax=Stenotrophomonas maltophilia TaxID=40324 RepID=A0A2J0SR16_STEMA|nr:MULTISPECIES: DUF805 domain-containing protein [Stenotrophomonas]MBA0309677.1 DUF805 domain-containing protein [Stenotrophomonas maltophilia]MBH1746278.1 DUF805 domain-containing protein [Stenotrophomonas maltophilia]MBH1864501.1 DUF805 domain-containing protein [Stenotrophomonas maltophilia]MDH1388283.1 DUF805 domain-containing protein [Stenotrophomonas sp. GD03701]MDH1392938.1 DUF805 domain-containing protein [Stenotrophomonas sp. GD03702]
MHKMMVPLKRYTQFTGRASRSEYWWFQLFMMMFTVPLNVLGLIAGHINSTSLALVSSGLTVAVWLALALPLIAVTIRRLHDTDRSGWWLLLMLVPFAGLAVLVFMLLPSTPVDNRFGKPVPHV